jgi:S-adenosylmethionine synthetase
MSKRLFTSESVTEGHPDKIADQISDAILDSLLSQDSKSRVAVETLITTGQVHVAGEVTTNGYADVMTIVRDTVLNIGYDSSDKGFDGNSCGVSLSIGQQSQDIAQGVDDAYEKRLDSSVDPLDLQGAGDQGLMFGYACEDTKELMPLPISLAHKLAQRLSAVRKSGELSYLRPDGKTQVTIEYDGDKAVALNTIVISSQHSADVDVAKKLTPEIIELVINPVLADVDLPKADLRTLINPTGRFVIGGPMATPALLVARSSLILMAEWHVMVVAHLVGKTHLKLTALRLMQCVGWQKTLWQPVFRLVVKFKLPMRSEKPNQ